MHPATATAHLRRLVDGGLVRVRVQGRHRYHELAGPKVAAVLETLAQLAGPSYATGCSPQGRCMPSTSATTS